jgi:hypothetical protein
MKGKKPQREGITHNSQRFGVRHRHKRSYGNGFRVGVPKNLFITTTADPIGLDFGGAFRVPQFLSQLKSFDRRLKLRRIDAGDRFRHSSQRQT